MDLFIKADSANAQATYAALAQFGAPLQGIRPEDFADRSSFFRFGSEPRGFDILPDIPGVDFEAAWQRRVEDVIDAERGLTSASPSHRSTHLYRLCELLSSCHSAPALARLGARINSPSSP